MPTYRKIENSSFRNELMNYVIKNKDNFDFKSTTFFVFNVLTWKIDKHFKPQELEMMLNNKKPNYLFIETLFHLNQFRIQDIH